MYKKSFISCTFIYFYAFLMFMLNITPLLSARNNVVQKNILLLHTTKDSSIRNKIEQHLSVLNQDPRIHLTFIPYPNSGYPETYFLNRIKNNTDILIPLISVDFINDKKIAFLRLIDFAHNSLDIQVVPILIRATVWENIPVLTANTVIQHALTSQPLVEQINQTISDSRLANITRSIKRIILTVDTPSNENSSSQNEKNSPSNENSSSQKVTNTYTPVEKNITSLSKSKKIAITIGFIGSIIIPIVLLFLFTPTYHHFKGTLIALVTTVLTIVLLTLYMNPLESRRLQDKILYLLVSSLFAYFFLFHFFCVKSMYNVRYYIRGWAFKEEYQGTDKSAIDLLINKRTTDIWDYTFFTELIVLLGNVSLKILLGISFYIIVQRIWRNSEYQNIIKTFHKNKPDS